MKNRESLEVLLGVLWVFAVGSARSFLKACGQFGDFQRARLCVCSVVIVRSCFCAGALLIEGKKTPSKPIAYVGYMQKNSKTRFFTTSKGMAF